MCPELSFNHGQPADPTSKTASRSQSGPIGAFARAMVHHIPCMQILGTGQVKDNTFYSWPLSLFEFMRKSSLFLV